MKFYLKNIFVGVFLLSLFLLPLAVSQAAADCGPGMSLSGGVCLPTETGLSDMSIRDLLQKFMYWLLLIVGMIAIIAFVIAGIQYLASAGDEKLAEKGKQNMLNAIIGIIVALSGLVVINAISSFLSTSTTAF